MTFPPDSTMQLLAALALGWEFVTVPETGRMAVLLGGNRACEVAGEDLDAAVERGWVVTDGERIGLTEKGRYWLGRWQKAKKMRLNT